jgi:hypothetical protein
VATEIKGREEIEIFASREDVYNFRLDCLNLPRLNPAVRNVRRMDGGAGPPGAGTSYRCDVDLEWGECFATVHIIEAVFPSRIVLDMETVLRSKIDDAASCVRSNEVASFSDLPGGGTRLDVELTLFPPDSVPADKLEVMKANAGLPIKVELAAMKRAFEDRPKETEEANVEA